MATSPVIDIEPLRTILQMECQRDYANTAVIGGLDRYLSRWARETRDKINSPQLLAHFNELQLTEPSYATCIAEKRKTWVKDILDWLIEA